MTSLLTVPAKADPPKDKSADSKRAAIAEAARRPSKAPEKKAPDDKPKDAEDSRREKPALLDSKLLAVARQKALERDKKKEG
jgi:hypothetical protein